MDDFQKHLGMMKEKLRATREAYKDKEFTVVGDLAIKVVEQALEAEAARDRKHLGDHRIRFKLAEKIFSKSMFDEMRKLWFIYGDLGYDGVNGARAKRAMKILEDIVQFFEKRWGVEIY
jgi:hypothetical protein